MLDANGGPYFLGERFSLVDIMCQVFDLCHSDRCAEVHALYRAGGGIAEPTSRCGP